MFIIGKGSGEGLTRFIFQLLVSTIYTQNKSDWSC